MTPVYHHATQLSLFPEKKCTKCLELLPATTDFFYPDRTHKDGLTSRCRKCKFKGNQESIERQKQNPTKRITYPNQPAITLTCFSCGKEFERKQFVPRYESIRRTHRVYCPEHSPSKSRQLNVGAFADAYLQGESLESIGERYHCSLTTVRYHLIKLGIDIRITGSMIPQISGKPPRVSKLEDRVANELTKHKIGYTRQYGVVVPKTAGYVACLDFLLDDGRAIEVNGTFWHVDPRKYPNGPVYKSQMTTCERHAKKVAWLAQLGIPLIELWEIDLEADMAGTIEKALQR